MRLLSDQLQLSGTGTLQLQLYQALQQQMRSGNWPSGAYLPSSRQLAMDLSLSRNTVNQALQQLVAEGYLLAQPGRGYQVAALPEHYFNSAGGTGAAAVPLPSQNYGLPDKTGPANGLLQPGVSALTQFPYAIWQRLLQRHCQRPQLSGFADPLGYLPLRQALAGYLRQSRQVVCDEHSILITAGAQQALFIAAKLVAKAGQQVLMESPGYPRLKHALQLCELDVPMHIHSTGSHSERSPYTLNFINEETLAVYNLVQSDVFKDFPKLKVVCSHGGGSIPYQIGRFQSSAGRRGLNFLDGMRNIYYDTVLYSEEALRLLIKTVGADRCLFGSECPGVGSTIDPATGRQRDDIRPVIESFEWLSADDKQKIFSENARFVFGLKS